MCCASARLKDDKEVVVTAMSQNGRALEFASDELQAEKKVVIPAVAKSVGEMLKYASAELHEGALHKHQLSLVSAHLSFVFFLLAARPTSSA